MNYPRPRLVAALLMTTLCVAAAPNVRAQSRPVKAWEQQVVIPTYNAGGPEPNPMFYLGRSYQGAQGRVYPYPLYDTPIDEKTDKPYQMLSLENEYVRIGILPELGGRVFEAVDKTNNYDFVYHQHVIKPALVGMIGAWISGGIEWNIPHHHRATTLLPVQAKIEEHADGSKTVWVGELELRQRMRWAVGYTLHPGKSVLECTVRIINRTPLPNTMLCFANVAVHANDNYQVIFPPSTQYVTFHGKNQFTTWPIATTRFNGADFTRGVDVSWYKNHNSAMSMFAWNYEDDFFAGYDHGKEAGIVSVADHHVVPGKKFWTWGNGPYGKMWDRILTDDDGPYIELMVGAYSDNQPDYSWLQPFETKSFQMNWYPIRNIGGTKNANLDAAVNLEISTPDGLTTTKQGRATTAKIGFNTTTAHSQAIAKLTADDKVLLEEKVDIDPAKPFVKEVAIPQGIDEHDLRASLSADGKELIAYSPVRLKPLPMPEPVVPPPAPKDIKTVEELYLVGQRIEQFYSPSADPEPYWEEALARDPENSRVNTTLGIRRLRAARYSEAEQHFRTAIKRLTKNYTSPKDGEPFYYLGVTLKAQGKNDEAYDALFKATWSQAWRGPAYFELAEIDSQRGDPIALDHVDRALEANALNLEAIKLKVAVLRHLHKTKEALAIIDAAARDIDPLDFGLSRERLLARIETRSDGLMARLASIGNLATTLRDHPTVGLEAAVGYANAGFRGDAIQVLEGMIEVSKGSALNRSAENRSSPLVYYYLADFDREHAAEYRQLAMKAPADLVFPFQSEAIPILRRAIEANPKDARAPYYLGNLLYDWQPEEAIKLWEQSAAIDPSLAIVHRNLAVAYAHRKPADNDKAVAQLQLAVAAPQKFALHFTELDAESAAIGVPPEKRLALLEQNHDVVAKRDDALSREIGLKVFAGKYDDAIKLMTGRKFSVWEGESLEVADHWVNAHLLRGRKELTAGQFSDALRDFEAAKSVPENLPNARNSGGTRGAEVAYWIGAAHDGAGEKAAAKKSWHEAVDAAYPEPRRGSESRISPRLVQDYYRALAKQKLGQTAEAERELHGMVDTARQVMDRNDDGRDIPDSFGPRMSKRTREALAHYIAGLGHLGLGETDTAKSEFQLALQATPDALGAHTELLGMRAPSSK